MPGISAAAAIVPRKPAHGFLAQSGSDVAVSNRMGDGRPVVDRRLMFTVAKALDSSFEGAEATVTAAVPYDRRLTFIVAPPPQREQEADGGSAATSPDLATSSDARGLHAHSSETGGEDSFIRELSFSVLSSFLNAGAFTTKVTRAPSFGVVSSFVGVVQFWLSKCAREGWKLRAAYVSTSRGYACVCRFMFH